MLTPLLCLALSSAKAPALMVHYMPWFESKPVSGAWGWHWTMGKTDPDTLRDGKPDIASKYHPVIGPYDSGDPAVAEYHVQLMKLAGFDGILVDWYGMTDHFDYLSNHKHTQLIADAAAKAGLKFAIVYEDATVNQLLLAKKVTPETGVEEGKKLMRFLANDWFRRPNYLKLDRKPVFLVFGPQYYQSADWTAMFSGLDPQPAFFTLHHRKDPAMGAYDWPLPKGGLEGSTKERQGFYSRARDWKAFIPCAYPQFDDYYAQAGVHDSWGNIPADEGETYLDTLIEAFESEAPILQVATWNDWGEGTQIEPSLENGYQYLEATQGVCQDLGKPMGNWNTSDLRLPYRLYQLRKGPNPDTARLNRISEFLMKGKTKEAKAALDAM